MDDLVKRLRGYGSNRCWPHGPACDCTQAADRIEAFESQVRAADALAKVCLDLSKEAYGYEYSYETPFHRDVHETLDAALAAYTAAKKGGA